MRKFMLRQIRDQLTGFIKSLKFKYQRLPICFKTKMIRIYRKFAISVILEIDFDKFASVVRIRNDIKTINLAHYKLSFHL